MSFLARVAEIDLQNMLLKIRTTLKIITYTQMNVNFDACPHDGRTQSLPPPTSSGRPAGRWFRFANTGYVPEYIACP